MNLENIFSEAYIRSGELTSALVGAYFSVPLVIAYFYHLFSRRDRKAVSELVKDSLLLDYRKS